MLRNHNLVLILVSRGLNSFIFLEVDELEPAQKKRCEQLAYLQSEEFQKILNAKSKHTGILKEVWPPSSHDWGLRPRELIGLLIMISARSRYPNMPCCCFNPSTHTFQRWVISVVVEHSMDYSKQGIFGFSLAPRLQSSPDNPSNLPRGHTWSGFSHLSPHNPFSCAPRRLRLRCRNNTFSPWWKRKKWKRRWGTLKKWNVGLWRAKQ